VTGGPLRFLPKKSNRVRLLPMTLLRKAARDHPDNSLSRGVQASPPLSRSAARDSPRRQRRAGVGTSPAQSIATPRRGTGRTQIDQHGFRGRTIPSGRSRVRQLDGVHHFGVGGQLGRQAGTVSSPARLADERPEGTSRPFRPGIPEIAMTRESGDIYRPRPARVATVGPATSSLRSRRGGVENSC